MFRVTVQEPDAATTSNATTIVLEGRLCGPWVDELDRCWHELVATHDPHTLTVQLDGLTFVDADGKSLCRRIYAAGTALAASGCMMRALVEEIAA